MTLNKQSFEDIKTKSFGISFEDNNKTACELIEIKGINSHTLAEGQAEAFSLVFQSSDERIFEQNTYNINHPELNELALFLVPIGADDKGVRYEAVFT